MRKYLIALSSLILVVSSSAVAVSEEESTRAAQENYSLEESFPSTLQLSAHQDSGLDPAPSLSLGDKTELKLELASNNTEELSLKDELLTRVSPLGFRVSDSSYLNVSLERGFVVGVTIPCCDPSL